MQLPADLLKYAANRGPQRLFDVWSLSRGPVTIRCSLSTHPMGWELRLMAGDNLFRSRVCETERAVRETSESWHAEAMARGWT